MKGQWIGTYNGSSEGVILLNVDDTGTRFEGVAFLNDTTGSAPSVAVPFETTDKSNNFRFRTLGIVPIHPQTGFITSWESINQFFAEGTSLSEYADVEGSWDDAQLRLSWTTNLGIHGTCTLPRSRGGQASELVPIERDWLGFKEFVSTLEVRRCLFRGQTKPWRLRTSFHRTGRANLGTFITKDIQTLHKHLSARTKHVFNLEIPNENGAFYNLVQHHGYPTPLLDWSYSPYVAAFFAYRGISNQEAERARPDAKVRIYIFDQFRWRNDFVQLQQLDRPVPHLSIGEFLAIENERMIPQQAASTVTNIDDIESYIVSKETEDKRYLWAIDLPVSQRKAVVDELGYMGITAGSLFPGLDGACEELRERFFEA